MLYKPEISHLPTFRDETRKNVSSSGGMNPETLAEEKQRLFFTRLQKTPCQSPAWTIYSLRTANARLAQW